MIVACNFAYEKKILSHKDFNLIKKHYNNLNLPTKLESFFKKTEINKIIYFMKKDKKNLNEKINLILIKKIGKIKKWDSTNISDKELKKFMLKNYNY